MNRISFLTPALAVTGALVPEDFPALARQGFASVISNRLDGEEPGQLTARNEAVLAWRSGLSFRHVPAAKHEVLEADVVDALAEAMASLPGPVLLHCKSGLRSTIMWAAVAVRSGAALDDVIAAAGTAGFDLAAVREEIAESAAGGIAMPEFPASQECQAAA